MQQQCPNCGFRNRLGIVFCENCGASLIGESPINTRSLPEDKALPEVLAETVATEAQESILTENTLLRLEVEGGKEPIVLKPGHEVILGRRDPATGAMPDVDLTPFAGYRMGVSRRHAALRPNDTKKLDLWDLGSSNGTFLNGARLGAHRPYRLHDGDEIRLGQMTFRLYFQSPQSAQPVHSSAAHISPPIPAAKPTVTSANQTGPASPQAANVPPSEKDKASDKSDKEKGASTRSLAPATSANPPNPTGQPPEATMAKPPPVKQTVQVDNQPSPENQPPKSPASPSEPNDKKSE